MPTAQQEQAAMRLLQSNSRGKELLASLRIELEAGDRLINPTPRPGDDPNTEFNMRTQVGMALQQYYKEDSSRPLVAGDGVTPNPDLLEALQAHINEMASDRQTSEVIDRLKTNEEGRQLLSSLEDAAARNAEATSQRPDGQQLPRAILLRQAVARELDRVNSDYADQTIEEALRDRIETLNNETKQINGRRSITIETSAPSAPLQEAAQSDGLGPTIVPIQPSVSATPAPSLEEALLVTAQSGPPTQAPAAQATATSTVQNNSIAPSGPAQSTSSTVPPVVESETTVPNEADILATKVMEIERFGAAIKQLTAAIGSGTNIDAARNRLKVGLAVQYGLGDEQANAVIDKITQSITQRSPATPVPEAQSNSPTPTPAGQASETTPEQSIISTAAQSLGILASRALEYAKQLPPASNDPNRPSGLPSQGLAPSSGATGPGQGNSVTR